jgi:hypothetical protein
MSLAAARRITRSRPGPVAIPARIRSDQPLSRAAACFVRRIITMPEDGPSASIATAISALSRAANAGSTSSARSRQCESRWRARSKMPRSNASRQQSAVFASGRSAAETTILNSPLRQSLCPGRSVTTAIGASGWRWRTDQAAISVRSTCRSSDTAVSSTSRAFRLLVSDISMGHPACKVVNPV